MGNIFQTAVAAGIGLSVMDQTTKFGIGKRNKKKNKKAKCDRYSKLKY